MRRLLFGFFSLSCMIATGMCLWAINAGDVTEVKIQGGIVGVTFALLVIMRVFGWDKVRRRERAGPWHDNPWPL